MLRNTSIVNITSKIAALLLLVSGGLFALYPLLLGSSHYPRIAPATFLDTVAVPLDWVNLGSLSFPIQVDNYLVFQEFHSLAPGFTLLESYLFGAIIFLVSVSALTLVSTFKKIPFLIAGAVWIFLLTLFNSNGLNIGSVSTNAPLIILIAATIIPTIYFHVWKPNSPVWLRFFVLFVTTGAALFAVVKLSPIAKPALYLAEQSLTIGLGMSLAWIFWQGHAVVSGIYVLLARANQNISMKISWQILAIGILYLLCLIFLLLDLKGEVNLPFPTFSPLLLIIPMGVLGWISTGEKLQQEPNIAARSSYLKALYLLGLGICFWTFWKLEISQNQAAEELLKHLTVYSQFGFSLFFLVYLFSNFLSLMDSGKSVEKVLYKPFSLPYYHLRIGGLISILVVSIYMDIILSAQANSLTTNILGDYYYQTEQKLEASILYENSWAAFRKNRKAKNATAHLLFDLNQPTYAKQHLDESFSEAPQVDNILLLSSRAVRENKPFEAVFYLENGLKRFPNNPYLVNNLALLYVKTQKSDDAVRLLEENKSHDPVLLSNLIALQSKFQLEPDENDRETGLTARINDLAARNLKGESSDQQDLADLIIDLERQNSSMLLNAGVRNASSVKRHTHTSEDVVWIDSMSRRPEMIEYMMSLQESASIRSLAAGRVTESIKNLNGLAFRNAGDAGYYLNLTASILASNLDFEKAAKDLIAAEEKGFQAFRPYHLTILDLGGFEEDSERFRLKYQVPESNKPDEMLNFLADFNQSIPNKLFHRWVSFPAGEMKASLAYLILERKAHGLTSYQLSELGKSLKGKVDSEDKLDQFLQKPDWSDQNSLTAYTEFLGAGEELTANPYRVPMILSAAERLSDPLMQYEVLNTASEFSKDPLLWIRKVQAAKRVGLDNYATDAVQQMREWLTWDEIELLMGTNY